MAGKPPPGKPPKPDPPPETGPIPPRPVDPTDLILIRLVEAVNCHTDAINSNTKAIEGLTKVLTPQKATSVTMTTEVETADSGTIPQKETRMPPLQLYPDQKFKATFLFNGPIDGEPTIVCQGPFAAITQDPKVEEEVPGHPGWKQTKTTIHGHCTEPESVQGGEMLYFTANAKVDNPTTPDIEEIFQKFDDAVQWLAPSQPKATTVSLQCEVEA